MPQQEVKLARTIVFETCFTCEAHIAMTRSQLRNYKENGMSICCVLGHRTVMSQSELQLANKKLVEAQDLLARSEEALKNEKATHEATMKAKKRLERRVHAGVCSLCKRSFQNVRRHMTTKHGQANPQ